MSCNRCANQAEAALRAGGVPARQNQAAWAGDEASPSRCGECGRFLSPRVPRCPNPGCGKGVGQSAFDSDDVNHRVAALSEAEYERELLVQALRAADLGGKPDFQAFTEGDDPGIDEREIQRRLAHPDSPVSLMDTGQSGTITLGLPDGRVVKASVTKTAGRGRNQGKHYLNMTVHGVPILTNMGWLPGMRSYRVETGTGNAWKETDADFDIVSHPVRHSTAVRTAYESGLRPADIPDPVKRQRYAENLRAYGLILTSTPGDAAPPAQDTASLFTADDVIHTYTRAQAIEDGVLVDVSETAREAGFRWPVALTAGAWALIEDIPPRFQGLQDVQGRLWDTLWMARLAARRGGVETHYELILHHGRKTYATLKLVSGPGDQGEPVLTIMLPNED